MTRFVDVSALGRIVSRVGTGQFLSGIAVGGDCPGKTELHVDVLRNARVFVEFEPQFRIEGDIQQLSPDHPVRELWKAIAGRKAGRESAEQVTVFDSVGFALEDYSALRYVHELAVEFGEGEDIELVPELEDPRDLFGMVLNHAGEATRPTCKPPDRPSVEQSVENLVEQMLTRSRFSE